MEYHFWAELGRLGYNASFHSRLHILGGHLGHMIHVPITLAHYTVQQKWTLTEMLLVMVSVIPTVLYLVRNEMLSFKSILTCLAFSTSVTKEAYLLPETASSTTRSATTITTTITDKMDPNPIIIDPMASEGSMQTVKQYLSNQGKTVCFRRLH